LTAEPLSAQRNTLAIANRAIHVKFAMSSIAPLIKRINFSEVGYGSK